MAIIDFRTAKAIRRAAPRHGAAAGDISERILQWGCERAEKAFVIAHALPDSATEMKRDIWRGQLRRLRADLRKTLGKDADAAVKAAVAEEALNVYRGRYCWLEMRVVEMRAQKASAG